jgi:hypothetical protein
MRLEQNRKKKFHYYSAIADYFNGNDVFRVDCLDGIIEACKTYTPNNSNL